MPLGPKWARPGSHMFNKGLNWEDMKKIFLTDTPMPKALVYVMKHHLVDHFQVSSNYAPGAKK